MFKEFDINSFKNYIDNFKISRKIKYIQLHHTYSPSYKHFNGKNHQTLQQNMKTYHTKTNGWTDIGQNLTIFPDGVIMIGRPLNVAPAGTKGANSNGICIECVGNFDIGGDTMTEAQKNAIVGAVKILLDKFGLNASTGVTYHAWWTSSGINLGNYVKGKSSKTCPGTAFFGGNTRQAYKANLQPLIEKCETTTNKVLLESGNDIVWELMNGRHKIEIIEVERAIKAIDDAKKNANFSSLYWILYKLVNNR